MSRKDGYPSKQIDECNEKQSTLEQGSCIYETKLDDTCSKQTTCRTIHIEARAEQDLRIADSQAARKAEHEAGQVVLCHFKVFAAPSADKVKFFNECENMDVDTSRFDIAFPDVPDAVTCQTAPSDTCDSTWLSEEYSTQSWHSTATMASCKGCAPPTQAPTTPAPTPATPAPTPAPAPTYTFLNKGWCKSSRCNALTCYPPNVYKGNASLEELKSMCNKYEGCVAIDQGKVWATQPGTTGYLRFKSVAALDVIGEVPGWTIDKNKCQTDCVPKASYGSGTSDNRDCYLKRPPAK